MSAFYERRTVAYFLFVGILVVLSVVWCVVKNTSRIDLPKFNGYYRDYSGDEDPIPDEPERLDEPDEPEKP